MVRDELIDLGYAVLPQDARVRDWAAAAHKAALAVTADKAQQAKWLRHGGTWFVGVDALPNGPDGSIGGVPLGGPWEGVVPLPENWHNAQLSVVHPGYPRRDPEDTDAAHAFRRDRDSAHLDGLMGEGEPKRRFLREPHSFILGIPLNRSTGSPLVVWEGSHEIIRDAMMSAYAGMPAAMWPEIDVTEIYKDARAEVFETCERIEVPLEPGQSVLVHRLTIHGVAPWAQGAKAPAEGRMIAYFRPILPDPRDWLRSE